jgi:tRNA U34 5-methylaminomethyl-2-thiouridine-forming methyltransferase MnmC
MYSILKTTADGSQTLYSEMFHESYHSIHGAVTESVHVFINAAFNQCDKDHVSIFEVGFGTGLNAYLTYIEAKKRNVTVSYHSIELFPLEDIITRQLEYAQFLSADNNIFRALHDAPWHEEVMISDRFLLKKIRGDLLEVTLTDMYDLVYFDAFSPVQQPELWTEPVFKKLYDCMNEGGIFATYCAKGIVRRTLNKVGFTTERLPGPPGKHEMLRAIKILQA